MASVLALLLVLSSFTLSFAQSIKRAGCTDGYNECAPDGATSREVPALGGDWSFFYESLVSSVPASPDAGASPPAVPDDGSGGPVRRQASQLCCAATTTCLLISSYNLPACYDKFTTNYFLNDGSHGTVSNGSYITANGGIANLVTGDYTSADGTKGNIYDQDPADKPDTANLPMPTPFTSSGIGSAIPGSELGTVGTASKTSGSGTVSSSITTSPAPTTASTSSLDTVSNSGIIPPFITDTITTTPSILTGTVGFPSMTPFNSSTGLVGTATGATGMSLTTTTAFATAASPSISPPIFSSASVSIFVIELQPVIVASALGAFFII